MKKLVVFQTCDTEGCCRSPVRTCSRCGRDMCSVHSTYMRIEDQTKPCTGYFCPSCNECSVTGLIRVPKLVGTPVNIIIPAELSDLKRELDALCSFTIGPIDVDKFLESTSVIVNKYLEYRRLVNGLHVKPDSAIVSNP